jgi:PAS domain-containing protein
VRDGQLWGLIAMHHHAPRGVSLAMCSAIELLAEVVSTRVAAIENYAHAQVSLLVRRLEQRLIDATTVEGDWRLALLRAPQTLLSPLEASGAALAQDGDILTTGEVPSTAEMRELLKWVGAQPQMQAGDTLFACSSVERANPALSPLTPTACGVLAVRLSHTRADWLMWFRKEQLHTVTWAGDPNKPTTFDPKDFSQISPRRSFAAWSELVRGTAVPWTIAEQVTARAIGAALVDIIVQVHAVRMLIAESQLVQIRATVNAASEPVMVANPMGEVIFANQALQVLCGLPQLAERVSVSEVFEEPQRVLQLLAGLERQPWRGECQLKRHEGPSLPVSVRMESVPGRDGKPLGVIVSLTDLRGARQTAAARLELESSLNAVSLASAQARADGPDAVMGAILTNSSLAAMDVADVAAGQTVAPLLQELQSSVERSAALYRQIKRLSS